MEKNLKYKSAYHRLSLSAFICNEIVGKRKDKPAARQSILFTSPITFELRRSFLGIPVRVKDFIQRFFFF